MKYIVLMVKGFIMGIANIIPGVSGGTIALILGIYEELVNRVSHLFENLIDNIKYIIPIAIGMGISLLVMSGVINYSYENFPLPTMMFFVGLVVGGIPMLYGNIKGKKESKNKSNYLIFLITFGMVILLSLSNVLFNMSSVVDLNNLSLGGYLLLFLVGIIAAGTMVIPGISGSLVLMLLGYYYPIISKINELKSFDNLGSNILILGVFGVGVLFGIVIIAKLLEMLFKKHTVKTYFGVLGFVTASIIAIPIASTVGDIVIDIPLAIISLVMMFIGSVISFKLGEK